MPGIFANAAVSCAMLSEPFAIPLLSGPTVLFELLRTGPAG